MLGFIFPSFRTATQRSYKQHRRVVEPAITVSTYALVARETVKLYYEIVESEGWSDSDKIYLSPFNCYMAKFALDVSTRCGLGLPHHWMTSGGGGGGGETSFDDALPENAVIRPAWAYKQPIKILRIMDGVCLRLGELMKRLALAAHPGVKKHDLFNRMVHASINEGKTGLDEKDFIGDGFAILFAGHEMTAHVLSATTALLALHQAEQEDVYSQVHSVLNGGRDFTVNDYDRLYKVFASFQEAAPAAVAGYDSEIFAEPDSFKPSRWYGAHEPDLNVPSLGSRSCLGRKFAMMEAVCLLALLLRDWKVGVLLLDGETEEQWKDRVLHGGLIGLGYGVHNMSITLTKRT